ncbi:MAG TPA: GNAT family N-acetyltransferase [Alphaproteobacteria bacterium]|nr:GNAT family N-acetyltransferase [Alphaproteobacteria bacterium]
MNERYLIRRALVVDAPEIARVHVQAWRESYRDILSARTLARLSVEQRRIVYSRHLADMGDSGAHFVVVEPGEGVVGFCSCGPRRSGRAEFAGEFYTVYLVDAAKRQGLGRRMMARMARWMVGQGFGSALVLVLKENHPARQFYEHLGGRLCFEAPFTLVDEPQIEVGYGWDDLSPFLDPEPPSAHVLPLPRGDG